MNSRRREVAPAQDAGFRPGVVEVRLVCDEADLPAALTQMEALHGEAWQPSTRKPSRHGGGRVVQYGTLIVAVPRSGQ